MSCDLIIFIKGLKKPATMDHYIPTPALVASANFANGISCLNLRSLSLAVVKGQPYFFIRLNGYEESERNELKCS